MPKEIDQDAFNELKVMDINNPPTKNIPHQSFPKMIYLHPKDKTKEHLYKTVHTSEELDAHEKKGWKTKPHIPVEPEEDLSEDFEAEFPDQGKGNGAADLDGMKKEDLVNYANAKSIAINPADKKEVILAAIKAAEANA